MRCFNIRNVNHIGRMPKLLLALGVLALDPNRAPALLGLRSLPLEPFDPLRIGGHARLPSGVG